MTTEARKPHAIDINALNRADKNNRDTFDTCISVENLNLFYGSKQALHNVSMQMPRKKVTAYIGPSGCGKSTLLRCINRMNDLVDGVTIQGKLLLD
ncbi:partial Phosphate import ATP-binding protein PstB 3, partial [Gammaproteobacteria bacterium]